jgi:hypothetical protein
LPAEEAAKGLASAAKVEKPAKLVRREGAKVAAVLSKALPCLELPQRLALSLVVVLLLPVFRVLPSQVLPQILP